MTATTTARQIMSRPYYVVTAADGATTRHRTHGAADRAARRASRHGVAEAHRIDPDGAAWVARYVGGEMTRGAGPS